MKLNKDDKKFLDEEIKKIEFIGVIKRYPHINFKRRLAKTLMSRGREDVSNAINLIVEFHSNVDNENLLLFDSKTSLM